MNAARAAQVIRLGDLEVNRLGFGAMRVVGNDRVWGEPRDLVKLTVFVRDMNNLVQYRAARQRFFSSTTPPAAPAVTLVGVSRLYAGEIMLEIEGVAAA